MQTKTAAKPKGMRPAEKVFAIQFGRLYQAYTNKVERKGHTTTELDQVLCWLTGYTAVGLKKQLASDNDLTAFFDQAPKMNPRRSLITGVICGVRIEELDDPLMQMIRQMDKLVDELAKGRAMEKILRGDQTVH
jgi:hypothetical protein